MSDSAAHNHNAGVHSSLAVGEPEGSRSRATIVGLIPVIIWGAALPACRVFQAHTGLFAYLAITFGMSGLIGVITQRMRREPLPPAAVLREPVLYYRGLFFALHEALAITAAGMVSTQHLPLVILLNYFWPTAVILCSISLAGVHITRPWVFVAGTITVLGSLAIEMLGGENLTLTESSSSSDLVAYGLVFIGAVSWGLYSALSRRSGERSGGGKVVPYFQLALAACAAGGFIVAPSVSVTSLEVFDIAMLLIYSLFLWLSYLAWDHSMRRGNIVYVSLFADFIPWLSLIVAAMIAGSPITPLTVVSAITLVGGAILTRYGTVRRAAA